MILKSKYKSVQHDCAKAVEEEGNGDGGEDGIPAKGGKFKVFKNLQKEENLRF